MIEQRFPAGWDRERVARLIAEYDLMDEDQQVAEDEAAETADGQTVMVVPTEIVPEIRRLIAQRAAG